MSGLGATCGQIERMSLTTSGCGPIGLISAAVAHAYSARKIIGIEISPARVEFARKYMSPITGKPIFDHVFLNTDLPSTLPKANGHTNGHSHLADQVGEMGPAFVLGDGQAGVAGDDFAIHEPTPGDIKWEAAKEVVAEWIEAAGETSEFGFDKVIEATGTEDGGHLSVALAKPGGTCQYCRSQTLALALTLRPWRRTQPSSE